MILKVKSKILAHSYFKIQIQEPEAHGINKVAIVELNAFSNNEVRVQGVRESWVIGKTATLLSLLKENQSNLVTTYKRFGITFNQMAVLALLVVLPEFSSWIQRRLFLGLRGSVWVDIGISG